MVVYSTSLVATLNLNRLTSNAKFSLFVDFIKVLNADVLFLQEVVTDLIQTVPDYQVLFNFDPEFHCGTAILVKIGHDFSDVVMLPDGRGVACTIDNVRYINIYAPSGADGRAFRRVFFNSDICSLLRGRHLPVILGGDFNCVLEDRDQQPTANKCLELQTLVRELKLVDVWRHLHPHDDSFTFYHATGASRLDRIYVSGTKKECIVDSDIRPVLFSDHCSHICKFHSLVATRPRFSRVWKFNVRHLSNPRLEPLLASVWQRALRYRNFYASTISWWAEYVKPVLRKAVREFSAEVAHWEKSTLAFYEQCLRDAISMPAASPALRVARLRQIKGKITDMRRAAAYGSVVRSQAPGQLPDEEPSVFHYLRERRRADRRVISEIVASDGSRHRTQAAVLSEAHRHFAELFRVKQIDDAAITALLQDVPHVLTVTDRRHLNEPFTVDEIFDVLKLCSHNKAPGSDGFPAEFYLRFWHLFGATFVDIFNEILSGVEIPVCFLEGILTLIPKTPVSHKMDNFRPITLLNGDYKLFTKCISSRLRNLMPKIISPSQYCAVPRRNIFDAVTTYRDAIAYSTTQKIPFGILSIDFAAAFDRISHAYLRRVMQKLGFGVKFVKMIFNIFNGSTSRVSVNGVLTEPLSISSSVKQGCPLSMSLFALALDPLLRHLNGVCRGISIAGTQHVCRAYADDLGLLVSIPSDLDAIRAALRLYEGASGAKINPRKTVFLPVYNATRGFVRPWFQVKSEHRILGVRFRANLLQTASSNWRSVLHGIRALAYLDATRTLSLHQRVRLINTFLLGKCWYLAQLFHVPRELGRAITQAVYWFLWRGDIFKVSYETCTLSREGGGLGLVHFATKAAALLIHRTLTVMETHPSGPTAVLFDTYRPPSEQAPLDPTGIPCRLRYVREFFMQKGYVDVDDLSPRVRTVRRIYDDLRGHPTRNSVELKNPNSRWKAVWTNINAPYLPSDVSGFWFKVVNRTLSTNDKLYRIQLRPSSTCVHCPADDTLEHRLLCPRSLPVWEAARRLLALINRTSAAGIGVGAALVPDHIPFPAAKRAATTWLLGHAVYAALHLQHDTTYQFFVYLSACHLKIRSHAKYRQTFARFLEVMLEYAFKNLL